MRQFKSSILYIAFIGTIFSACSKLEEEVFSSVFTSNFYSSPQDAEAALTATYGPLSDLFIGPAALLSSDLSADQTYPRAVVGRNTLTLFSYDQDYSTQKSFGRAFEGPYQFWTACYKGIENANWVLEKVPAIRMDQNRKNAILGEAYFLRALYHFWLTRNFRDVIIRTTPSKQESDAIKGKSPAAEVYQQIFSDLNEAIAKLPSYSPSIARGRASKEVAIGLYAKAALYAEQWQVAKDKALEVINSGRYSLVPLVLDLYNVDREDFARQEIMFAFEGEPGANQDYSFAMGLYGPRNSQGRDYGNATFGSVFAYQSFFDSFDPSDERRLLLDTFFIDRNNNIVRQKDITPITPKGVLVKKYMDKNSNGDRNRCNVPILRLADMYLIASEAEARLNGATTVAYQYINAIRNRAGINDLPSGLSRDAFLNAVLQERSWEFFAEGDRWYDLTRTNTFMQVIPLAVNDVYPVRTPQPRNRYFPIPEDELRANPLLEQNPDWR